MKQLLLAFLFTAFTGSSFAQLAKISTSGEQQYRLNIKRGGPVLVTPFTKSITTSTLNRIVSDNNGGYLKVLAIKGNYGSTKNATYVHFLKLDGKLNAKGETDVSLFADGSENMEPVTGYDHGGFLNIITAGADNSLSNAILTYWKIDLATLTLVKKNVPLTELPFNKGKTYSFRSFKRPDGNGFVLTVLEEGRKKENSVLHSLSFDASLALTAKQSTTLPFVGEKGRILETIAAANGTVYCLLGYPDEKDEDVILNSLLIAAKNKGQVIPLTHNGDQLINCAIGLSAGDNLLLGGLLWPGKKDYTSGLVVSTVSAAGKLEPLQQETFSPQLLEMLEEADKKGLKRDYYVRSVSQRDNGTTDVVLNFCKWEGGWSRNVFDGSSTHSSVTTISDALVLSYNNGRLVSTIPIKRNLEQRWGTMRESVQTFSMPNVFTRGNDLYLMYYDNPENTLGTTDGKKPKRSDFTKGSLVLAKIDGAFKPTQQELIRFDKKGDFHLFYDLRPTTINDKTYVFSTDEFGVFTKNVKTTSLLVELK